MCSLPAIPSPFAGFPLRPLFPFLPLRASWLKKTVQIAQNLFPYVFPVLPNFLDRDIPFPEMHHI